MPPMLIRAAGTVLLRRDPDGSDLQVALIHRGRRRDWSLPKGKVDPGEHVAATAVRETWEETGYRVVLGAPLPTASYDVAGRAKTVNYWRGEIVAGAFAPNEEADEFVWLDLEAGYELLTYSRDVAVVKAAVESYRAAPKTEPLVILRHAQAMRRTDWAAAGEPDSIADQARPLTADGGLHAAALGDVLAAFGIDVLMSSDARRCRETVGPYSVRAGSAVLHEPLLSEEGHRRAPHALRARMGEIARVRGAVVVCTHRPVLNDALPALAQAFGRTTSDDDFAPGLSPGGLLVIHRDSAALERGECRAVSVERHAIAPA